MNAMSEIESCEDRRVAAMINADTAELERLFAPDLRWTHSSGSTDTRDGFVEKLSSGTARYLSIKRQDVTARQFGDAILCSGITIMQVELRGATRDMRSRYSNLWVLRDGAWQMVHWQSTAVAA